MWVLQCTNSWQQERRKGTKGNAANKCLAALLIVVALNEHGALVVRPLTSSSLMCSATAPHYNKSPKDVFPSPNHFIVHSIGSLTHEATAMSAAATSGVCMGIRPAFVRLGTERIHYPPGSTQ